MADLTKTKITAQEFHEMYDETMEHVELIEGGNCCGSCAKTFTPNDSRFGLLAVNESYYVAEIRAALYVSH